MLWRVATDCDTAKLEVAKAGAVTPAVALLQSACQDLAVAPAATEVHVYCMPIVMAEECVHHKIKYSAHQSASPSH